MTCSFWCKSKCKALKIINVSLLKCYSCVSLINVYLKKYLKYDKCGIKLAQEAQRWFNIKHNIMCVVEIYMLMHRHGGEY